MLGAMGLEWIDDKKETKDAFEGIVELSNKEVLLLKERYVQVEKQELPIEEESLLDRAEKEKVDISTGRMRREWKIYNAILGLQAEKKIALDDKTYDKIFNYEKDQQGFGEDKILTEEEISEIHKIIFAKWGYKDEDLQKDISKVAELRSLIKNQEYESLQEQIVKINNEKRAECLEVFLVEGINSHLWFLGEQEFEALATRTSDYDDLQNRIDAVIEFNNVESGVERLAVAVDASSAKSLDTIIKKMFGKISELSKKNLQTIKFYGSEILSEGPPTQQLKNLIPAVLGTSNIFDLGMRFLLEKQISKEIDEGKKAGKNDSLANLRHLREKTRKVLSAEPTTQLTLLLEMKSQLSIYSKLGIGDFSQYKDNLSSLSGIVNSIIEDKIKQFDSAKTEEDYIKDLRKGDPVFDNIVSVCEALEKIVTIDKEFLSNIENINRRAQQISKAYDLNMRQAIDKSIEELLPKFKSQYLSETNFVKHKENKESESITTLALDSKAYFDRYFSNL